MRTRSGLFTSAVLSLSLAACGGDAASEEAESTGGNPSPTEDDAGPAEPVGGSPADPDAAPPVVPPDAGPGASCVPDRALWDTRIAAEVDGFCGACHGGIMPQYGAPGGFDDYDTLLGPSPTFPDARLVDRLAIRAGDGTMPPTTWPHPPAPVLDAIVDWASCGTLDADPREGLVSSEPVFAAPAAAPADLPYFDLTANAYPLAVDAIDDYRCFTVTAPVDGPRFIKRFEVNLEDTRIVHHIVLLRDPLGMAPDGSWSCFDMPEGSDYLYAWAPGQDALEFPDGGLRVEPGARFVLQIHYNNALALPDVSDDSGVRLYHGPPEGTEYGMVAIGPVAFNIPARARTDVSGLCDLGAPSTMLAGMPHMHTLGSTFHQTIHRADGTEEPLIGLTGWDFNAELFYHLPVELGPGDRIETVCGFENEGNMVRSGARTQDEMCFNFAYVTPPPTARYCDGASDEPDMPLNYVPGECAPEGALSSVSELDGLIQIGLPEPLTGGPLPADGVFALTAIEFWMESPATPLGELDIERTTVKAGGQLIVEGGQLTLDTLTALQLALAAGPTFTAGRPNSVTATYTPGMAANELDLAFTCGTDGASTWTYETADDRVTLEFVNQEGGLALRIRLSFAPAT